MTLSSSNKIKCMANSKENKHWDLGSEIVNVILESWKNQSEFQKFVSKKGMNPRYY